MGTSQLSGKPDEMQGGGGDNFMVHGNGDKLWPGGPIGFNADYNSFTA